MADRLHAIKCISIAFVVNFYFCQRNPVEANTVSSSTIQSTVSSSHSVEVLSTVAPTRTSSTKSGEDRVIKQLNTYMDCPDGMKCNDLVASCLECNFNTSNYSCVYGEISEVECKPISSTIKCTGDRNFNKTFDCRYCYQTDPKEYSCEKKANCKVVSSPRERYETVCTVKENILCLGNRTFPKLLLCNWTSGYRWSTSVLLSLTLGGFGVDRFYLGHWKEGLGKLFSFGGLGVWTLVDLILILIGYVGPEDGSLYIF
ncbi:TM2 domain-containing protein 3-like [Montipora capricornis]|uniref:TM2 domain-containing protein 3-like n=1 Tax=Montipora capricornis TaxID=246305 RepID=UPI0035F16666